MWLKQSIFTTHEWEWEVYTTYENGDDWRNGKRGIVLPALSIIIQLWVIINNPTWWVIFARFLMW